MEVNNKHLTSGQKIKFQPDDDLKVGSYPTEFNVAIAELKVKIEKKLTSKEDMQMELHPSTLLLALLSKSAYNYRTWRNKGVGTIDWRKMVIDDFSPPLPEATYKIMKPELDKFQIIFGGYSKATGFHGVVFFKSGNKFCHPQLVIAHEGTQRSIKHFIADIHGIAHNNFDPIINSAITFALTFVDHIVSSGVPKTQLSLINTTGHSLGGWLAQMSTFALKNLQFTNDKRGFILIPQDNPSYRDNDIHPHCEVFDSPGAFQILVGVCQHRLKIKLSRVLSELDISNFVVKPNIVNCVNDHVGIMYQLQATEKHCETLMKDVHKFHPINFIIKIILNVSNPKAWEVLKWPVAIFDGYNTKLYTKSTFKHVSFARQVASAVKSLGELGISKISPAIGNTPLAELADPDSVVEVKELGEKIHYISLNQKEKILFKHFKTIKMLRDLNEGVKVEFINCIEKVIDDLSTSELGEGIFFANIGNYNTFKNCLLAFSELQERVGNLVDFKTSYCHVCSDMNIQTIRRKYDGIVLKVAAFEPEDEAGPSNRKSMKMSVETFRDVQSRKLYHADENVLELLLLHLANCIHTGFNDWKAENTLLVDYNELTRFKGRIDEGVKNVFVDCSYAKDISLNFDICVPSTFIILSDRHKPNFSIEICETSYDVVLKRLIKVQGNVDQLGNWLTEKYLKGFLGHWSRPEMLKGEKRKDIRSDDLIKLLQVDSPAKLEIVGKKLPTIYDDEGLYLEPGITFESLMDCDNNFDGPLHSVQCIYTSDSSIAQSLKDKVAQRENYFYIESCISTNYLVTFREMCASSNIIHNLLEYRVVEYDEELFYWRLHFNPEFYKSRTFRKPIPDIRSPNFRHYLSSLFKKSDEVGKFGPRSGPKKEYANEVSDLSIISDDSGIRKSTAMPIFDQDIERPDEYFAYGLQNLKFAWNLTDPREILLKIQNELQLEVRRLTNPIQMEGMTEKFNAFNSFEHPSVSEKDYVNEVPDISIISDEPGMGKTMTMLKLADQYTKAGLFWVFYVDMKTFKFENISQNLDPDNNKFHCEILKCACLEQGDLVAWKIFQAVLESPENSKRMVFILDGYDEIGQSYRATALELMNHLRRRTSARIVVSTRDHRKQQLESKLLVLSSQFEPLNDYFEILKSNWEGIVCTKTDQEKIRFEEFCKKIESRTTDLLKEWYGVLGVPLHLKMVTDVFQVAARKYVKDGGQVDQSLPNRYTLGQLYDKYVKRKYKIYFHHKLGTHQNHCGSIPITDYERSHQFLAAEAIYHNPSNLEIVKGFMFTMFRADKNNNDNWNQQLYALGIVRDVPGGSKFKFIHRTIAEFYVAKVLIETFKEICGEKEKVANWMKALQFPQIQEQILDGFGIMLFPIENNNVRAFLCELIASDETLLGKINGWKLPALFSQINNSKFKSWLFETAVCEKEISLFSLLLQTIQTTLETVTETIQLFAERKRPNTLCLLVPSKSLEAISLLLYALKNLGGDAMNVECLAYGMHYEAGKVRKVMNSVNGLINDDGDPILSYITKNCPEFDINEYINSVIACRGKFDESLERRLHILPEQIQTLIRAYETGVKYDDISEVRGGKMFNIWFTELEIPSTTQSRKYFYSILYDTKSFTEIK